jgi:hypothetical protein
MRIGPVLSQVALDCSATIAAAKEYADGLVAADIAKREARAVHLPLPEAVNHRRPIKWDAHNDPDRPFLASVARYRKHILFAFSNGGYAIAHDHWRHDRNLYMALANAHSTRGPCGSHTEQTKLDVQDAVDARHAARERLPAPDDLAEVLARPARLPRPWRMDDTGRWWRMMMGHYLCIDEQARWAVWRSGAEDEDDDCLASGDSTTIEQAAMDAEAACRSGRRDSAPVEDLPPLP